MPVLTCPFKTIAAQTINPESVIFPKVVLLTTELSIKPTAQETWEVEGVSIQMDTKYTAAYFVNIKGSEESLENAITRLKEQIKFIEEQIPLAESAAKNYGEAAVIEQHEWEKSGGTGSAPGLLTNSAAQHNAESEAKSFKASVEALKRELQMAENELKELGRTIARERAQIPPLAIVARLYARQNELVWNSVLTPARFSLFISTSKTLGKRIQYNEWNEIISDHIQFNDPVDFTERENLTLTIELSAPPGPIEGEGVLITNLLGPEFQFSNIQAIVNYSRTVAGERE